MTEHLSVLYDQHALTLYKVICCHVKNNTEAELILEKTFLEIRNFLPPFELVILAGIARRLARQHQMLSA
jgi:hypothetical protein